MAKPIRHTLVSEGATDANLLPIIDWSLREVAGIKISQGTRASFWRLPKPPKSLQEKIAKAVELFPCDILFIHRDTDADSVKARNEEIAAAVTDAHKNGCQIPVIAVVPQRMLEAWMLFNESAIRHAAGNPNGRIDLKLPQVNKLDARPDPKTELMQALLIASELSGRRRKKFNTSQAFWRIVDFIEDYSTLRQLAAFRTFEDNIARARDNNWQPGFYHLS